MAQRAPFGAERSAVRVRPARLYALSVSDAPRSKKTCGQCKRTKPVSEFHRRGKGWQSVCKLCRADLDKGLYSKDPVHHWQVRLQRRQELLCWFRDLKQGKPCTDCGVSFHPVAMQWDHIGTDKLIDVAAAVVKGWGKQKILAEIAKCELVCANCHAIRTWKRNNGM